MSVTVTRKDGDLGVSFKYDPAVVEKVKGLRRRRWDPERKTWLIPAEDHHELIKALEGYTIQTIPEDLFSQLGKEAERGVACFICGDGISCRSCSYYDSCPVRDSAEHCICDGCFAKEDAYALYNITFAEKLG